jgi:hypothetical protein
MSEKNLVFALWLACIIGSWAAVPYQYFLMQLPPSTSIVSLILYATLEEGIISGIACWGSIIILRRIDLTPFLSVNILKRAIYPGIASGILVGLFVHFLLVKDSVLATVLSRSPAWAGGLASINAAIKKCCLDFF